MELLDLVGMSHKKNSRLNQLSGGEQQRIAIAIALANNPKLLLADEPTGSVDRKTADYILDVFRKLNQTTDLTILIVTHDVSLSRKVERVVSIRDGRTSSERIMKKEYSQMIQERGAELGWDSNVNYTDLSEDKDKKDRKKKNEAVAADTEMLNSQEEFAIIDKVGRVQIPREILNQIGVKAGAADKIRVAYEDGKIILTGIAKDEDGK